MADQDAGTNQNTGTEEGTTLLTGAKPDAQEPPKTDAAPDAAKDPKGQTDDKDGEGSEAKKDEGKEDEKPQPKAPEKYEFKVADGTPLDPEAVKGFEPIARELDLTQEQAQKLVDYQVSLVKAQNDSWIATTKAWVEEVKGDPVIGGKNLDSTLANGKRALKAFGSETFGKFLDQYGLGNHPEFIRFTNNVGKAMGEDEFKRATLTQEKRSAESILYGSSE